MTRSACRAQWVLPISAPPLRDAVIEAADQRIVCVRPATAKDRGRDVLDLGNVVVLPALVNAHTHLEFSGLASPLEPRREFASWIRQVVNWRRGRSGENGPAIRKGWSESTANGVGILGEIATQDGLADYAPRSRGTACIVFRELLGLDPAMVEAHVETAREHLACKKTRGTMTGVSPHAPYSVHPDLLRRCIDSAVEFSAPIAMHVAESSAEGELLRAGTGPLAELLKGLGVWREGLFPSRLTWLEILRELSRASQALIVHGNLLGDVEIDFMATQPQMSVVYCPRTHAAMGHPPHPWRRMLEAGVRVVLGTDSRASNPDLNLFEEVKYLHRSSPEFPAAKLLEMATRYGAQALGVDHDYGTLEAGKKPLLTILKLPDDVPDDVDIERHVLSEQAQAELRMFGEIE